MSHSDWVKTLIECVRQRTNICAVSNFAQFHFEVERSVNGMAETQELPPHVKELFDNLMALPSPEQCRKCGSKLIHVETTFFSVGEKFWTVPLPVCPMCDVKGNPAKCVPMRWNEA